MAKRNRPKISFAEIITSPIFWENYNKCLEMSFEKNIPSGFVVTTDNDLDDFSFNYPAQSELFDKPFFQPVVVSSKSFMWGEGLYAFEGMPFVVVAHVHPKHRKYENLISYFDLLNIGKFRYRNMKIRSLAHKDYYINPVSVIGAAQEKNKSDMIIIQEKETAWETAWKNNEWLKTLRDVVGNMKSIASIDEVNKALGKRYLNFNKDEVREFLDKTGFYNFAMPAYECGSINISKNDLKKFEKSLYLKI